MTGFSAIVFDFDGVLVESNHIKAAAFRQLFSAEPPAAQAAIAAFLDAGPGLSRFVKFAHIHREILGRPLDDAGMADLARRFALLVVDAVAACPAVAGAADFVAARGAEAAPLFIVSATPEDELGDILRRRGMAGSFRDWRGAPRGKPDNLRDLAAVHRFDLTAALMIGDGRPDYDAAVACGMRFIGRVPPGERNPFPADAPTVADLAALNRMWGAAPAFA